MFSFRRGKKKRICVVGLDGVPYWLLQRLADEGVMPHVAQILPLGTLHPMKASLPEISAVSWPSFMTGANPGVHGVFGFTDFKENSYDFRILSSADVRAPALWQKLGGQGKRSVVINQPSTYPARQISGVLVSGFVAIDLRRAVWPAKAFLKLKKADYTIDVDTVACRDNPARLKAELWETLKSRRTALDLFWESEDWDYFELVVTGTDRLQHFLWDALDDADHAQHTMFLDYYREIDGLIGEIYDRFQAVSPKDNGGSGFFLLSDHGFTGIRREVYLNTWLKEQGYVKYSTDAPESLEAVAPGTRAFVLDPARVYVNVKGRFPRGEIESDDAQAVAAGLKEAFLGMRFEGAPVVAHAFLRDEVYSGPFAAEGPDLVLVPHKGFDLKASVKAQNVFDRSGLQGMHTWDDALFWSADRVEKDDLAIMDIADILLKSLED